MTLEKKELVHNWSRTKSYYSEVKYPNNYDELSHILKNITVFNSITFRAGGQSYGDCNLNQNGILIDLKHFDKILEFNPNQAIISIQCSVLLSKILNYLMPKGYILKCLPGTTNATIGGCISSNVHGKDSFLHGAFGNNVLSMKLMNSDGRILDLNRNDKEFNNAIGTLGLTYVILEAKLNIHKINSTILNTYSTKFNNYKEMLELFNKYEKNNYEMMGAWIDHFNEDGRGIFKASKWSNQKDSRYKKINYLNRNIFNRIIIFAIYPIIKNIFVNKYVIKKLNYFLYKYSKRESIKDLHFVDFYYPQENILPEESRLFPGGKINIQILLPQEFAEKLLKIIFMLCNKYNLESWWLGIKKHRNDNYNLSFSLDGYDITLQWSQNYIQDRNFKSFYDKLIKIIIRYRCLIYLTQDILLSKENFQKIYKNYESILVAKKYCDKKNIFKNNLYYRLFD